MECTKLLKIKLDYFLGDQKIKTLHILIYTNYSPKMRNTCILSFMLIYLSQCSYDEQLGHNLCRLLVFTYCNPHHVKEWTCKPCR